MHSIAEIKATYNRSLRRWIVAFPPGPEGKRQATLAALAAERPDIAAEVKAVIANQAPLESRAIRAGQLLVTGSVTMTHLNVYRVKSQSSQTVYDISWWDMVKVGQKQITVGGWKCNCKDWIKGNQVHHYGLEYRSHAPYIEAWGITCKHALACHISLAIDPVKPCPDCNGTSLEGFIGGDEHTWPTDVKICRGCKGVGAISVNPHVDMDYYNEKVQDFEYTHTFGLQEQTGSHKGYISRYVEMTQTEADKKNKALGGPGLASIQWVKVSDEVEPDFEAMTIFDHYAYEPIEVR